VKEVYSTIKKPRFVNTPKHSVLGSFPIVSKIYTIVFQDNLGWPFPLS
jgi:hypothetical protein